MMLLPYLSCRFFICLWIGVFSMKNKGIVYLIVGSICIIILALGITTAWFTWRSSINTDVTFNVNGLDIINTNIDIVGKELYPTIDKENGIVEEFTVKQNNDIGTPVCSDFTLTLTTLPTELQHKSFKYKLYNGTNLVGSGNFEGKMQGQVITIATSQPITSEISTYKLYIWIDGNMDNPLSMGGKSFLFKLTIKANQQENACTPSIITCDADDVTPNTPVLADGMIPIKWDGSKWVKASTDNWYNYSNKEWANAVMVRTDKDSNVNGSRSREQYMSADEGTKILESDILAYYVWIPRYKYQLFNVNSEKMDPIEICTQFEGKDTTKSTGSTNGSWLTHPAFTFGTDELSGIWVGKFETSVDINDICYTNPINSNCNKELSSPRIKSNVLSLTYQQVVNQFKTSKKFGTTNYLTSNGVSNIDAHMMKNTEWGAVAYLKQSRYGLGTTRIGINAYYSGSTPYYIAGCGPASETDLTSKTTTCTNYTSSVGVKASTTGNVTGVYDMAGGAYDVVMAVMLNSSGTAPLFSSSGLTSGTLTSEYIDTYVYGTTKNDQVAYNRRILGDATGEVRGWYGESAFMPSSTSLSFFSRGGLSDYGTYSGVFSFSSSSGTGSSIGSFRSVLTAS